MVSKCHCCSEEAEGFHIFFLSCSISRQIWEHFAKKIFGVYHQGFTSISSMFNAWLLSIPRSVKVHIRMAFPIVICWFLWKAQNHAYFLNKKVSFWQIIVQIDMYLQQLGLARKFQREFFCGEMDCKFIGYAPCRQKRVCFSIICWVKPPLNCVKINIYVSVINRKASRGGVLMSQKRKLIFAFYKEFGEFNVLEVERLSLFYGVQLCIQRRVDNLLVEVNSKTWVTLVNSPNVDKWLLCNYIHQIHRHLFSLSASLSHVFREANSVANAPVTGYLLQFSNFHLGLDLYYIWTVFLFFLCAIRLSRSSSLI